MTDPDSDGGRGGVSRGPGGLGPPTPADQREKKPALPPGHTGRPLVARAGRGIGGEAGPADGGRDGLGARSRRRFQRSG